MYYRVRKFLKELKYTDIFYILHKVIFIIIRRIEYLKSRFEPFPQSIVMTFNRYFIFQKANKNAKNQINLLENDQDYISARYTHLYRNHSIVHSHSDKKATSK